MNKEQFARVKELFSVVCDLPPESRRERLLELTSDPQVIEEVLRLAARPAARTTQFSASVEKAMGEIAGDELAPGDSLDAWTLDREIGHGGMGAVYLARRSDGHFEQTAAIKLIFGAPSRAALEYLARERQILAGLSHPNIARLLDGGATPGGQPYLVMEYIDGERIDCYVELQHLGQKAVLALFLQVFDAVRFAHEQLIVHCDLKPSNILIDKSGRPYLLDFGIARLVDSAGAVDGQSSLPPGGSAPALAYTPHYASPEQREGGPASIRTDIYALGVMLGDVLRGAVGAPDADLAAIIAKATAKQKAQRYESVAAFADDIHRYQMREPVVARGRAPAYLARMFIVRRWPWLAAGALFAATVLGFSLRVVSERDRALVAERQAVAERDATSVAEAAARRDRDAAEAARTQAERERDRSNVAEQAASRERDRAATAESRAVKDRDRARQTSDFLVSIFDSSSPTAEFGDVPASRLIALAEQRVERELAGQPETQAELFGVLATVQSIMGNFNQSRDDYQRAIAIERKLDRPLALAGLLDRLAALRVSELGTTGAEAEAREALTLYENHAPNTREAADTMASLGNIMSILGKFDEGGKLLYKALAMEEAVAPASAGLATVLIDLGQHSMRINNPTLALEQFRRGLKLSAALVGADHPSYLSDEELFVRALRATGNNAEAEQRARRILAQRRKLEGNESNNVGTILNELGRVLSNTGRVREAIPLYEEAAAIHAKKSGKQSTRYALMLNNIATAQLRLGNVHKAASIFEEAVGVVEQAIPSDADLGKALFRTNLGLALISQQQPTRAIKPLQQAYDARRAALGDAHALTIEVELYLADVALQTGNPVEAASRLGRVRLLTPLQDPIDQLNFDRLSALEQAGRGNLDAAIAQLAAVEERRFKLRGAKHVGAWIAVLDRAELLKQRNRAGDREQAVLLARQVVENIKGSADPDAPAMLRAARLLTP